MTNNCNTIEVEAEKIEYENDKSHCIYLRFLLPHIKLTNHEIILDTFRCQVITTQ